MLVGRHNLPTFLQENKDVAIGIQQYGRENLQQLSVELMADYIHNIILPKLCHEATGATPTDESYQSDVKLLLKRFGLTSICLGTVCSWMKKLGFKYEQRRKAYSVDGHERPATVEYHKKFVERYLMYERRAHQWIQIPLDEEMEKKGLVPENSGYHFTDNNNLEMVEYHVDASRIFQERMNREAKFGGKLSVRLDEGIRPLIMFGHDKSIFKQYLLTKKTWKGPNGETPLVPKDVGQGVMLSAFQSREFGFGFALSKEQLEEVNHIRKGQKYKDEEAAKKFEEKQTKTHLKAHLL
jgi:hypothetical protein